MPKTKLNQNNIGLLEHQIKDLKRENSKLTNENIALNSQASQYREIITSLIDEPSFWSEKAIDTGLIARLQSLIK